MNSSPNPRTRYLYRALILTLLTLLTLTDSSSFTTHATHSALRSIPAASAPFLLAGGAGNQYSPSLAGNYMVYTTCRPGNCDVWGMDLRTRQAFPISEGGWDEGQPHTDGLRVVWRDGRNGSSRDGDNLQNNFDLYGAYLDERRPFPLASGPRMQNRPQVFGNLLVWADFRSASSTIDQEAGDIYVSDFPSNKDVLLVGARSAQVRPVTNGRYVVWSDYRNESDRNGPNGDIYAFDFQTRQELVITTAPDTQTDPAISGNIVVWTDFRKGAESDIYGYDLSTKREFPISMASGSQIEPGIQGNLVVWRDYRNEPNREQGINSDIYAFDLASGQEFPVFTGPGPQSAPRVLGSLVVWEDSAKGLHDLDLHGATVTGAAIAPLPAPPQPLYVPGGGGTSFQQTGKLITGIFNEYWQKNGGLAQQGYPISDLVRETSDLDGKPYLVQYTERAVFEYHPEQTDPKYRVLLSQLGTFRYRQKYPTGTPNAIPNNAPGSAIFPQTGKRLGGKFQEYWQRNGGLPQQGYPISDEFVEISDLDGKPYLVQYFERAVFEYHPENAGTPYEVLLSQLGTFRYGLKYGER